MTTEGRNPKAILSDEVIEALSLIQDHDPGSFREHAELLTDILLDQFECLPEQDLKRNLDLVQYFRFYATLVERLYIRK